VQACAGLRDLVQWRSCGFEDGGLGDHSPGGAEKRVQGSEIPWPAEQWLSRPMGWGLVCSTGCSFSKLWCGEDFQELGVQSADVSALPCALPQSSVSLECLQSLQTAQAVCGCVPGTILDLLQMSLI
jgi:hypothetical protein